MGGEAVVLVVVYFQAGVDQLSVEVGLAWLQSLQLKEKGGDCCHAPLLPQEDAESLLQRCSCWFELPILPPHRSETAGDTGQALFFPSSLTFFSPSFYFLFWVPIKERHCF